MKRYLLDTGIAGDLVFRRGSAVDRARQARAAGGRIGIATPVLAELLFGAENSPAPVQNRQRVMRAAAKWMLWPFDREAAEQYGSLAAELKRIGRRMQQFDMAIAAIALSLGDCTIVSKDGDLRAVPGLLVENWAQPS